MKNLTYIILMCLAVVFFSCENQHQINIDYNNHVSSDKSYEVDIPVGFTKKSSNGSNMAYYQEKTHTLIIIKALKNDEGLRSFAQRNQNDNGYNKFSYSLFEQSDSSCFYRVTNGTNMWSAYDCYMSKQVRGTEYVVHVSSDILKKDYILALIQHIQTSLKSHSSDTTAPRKPLPSKKDNTTVSKKNNTVSKETKTDSYKTRNTKYYSIKYPNDWKMLTNFDNMSDVYIGSPDGKIGFIVLYFDTDLTLSDIVAEGNSNFKAAGAKILSSKKITVNGQSGYKTIYDYWMDNYHVKNVSYTFKKNGKVFNVKFGNAAKEVDVNADLIEDIIHTFKMK